MTMLCSTRRRFYNGKFTMKKELEAAMQNYNTSVEKEASKK